MPAINLLLADPRLTMATFAQDLFEHVHLRARTGEFRAGWIGDEYHIVIGNTAFASKDKDEAWSVMLKMLLENVNPTPELRAAMELEGATVQEVDVQTAPIIEALTDGGMTDLGRATEQAREQRRARLKEVLPTFLASHGAFDSVESMLESLASETGINYTALEVSQAKAELNLE